MAGHLTITVGTEGGAFANKSCPQGQAFDNFFKCPGFARGDCSQLELTRTLPLTTYKQYQNRVLVFRAAAGQRNLARSVTSRDIDKKARNPAKFTKIGT